MKGDSNTLLRRNIHRIEKGLIMRPRKAVFALDYIAETVSGFVRACENPGHNVAELHWASDVLSQYFSVVDSEALAPELKPLFERFSAELDSDGSNTPYAFADKVDAQISPQQFMALCRQRRSVRWYEDRAVPAELLEQAVAMATLAPSACNRQPYRFIVSQDKLTAQQLLRVPAGTKGFGDNVPCCIVVVADMANYPTERDRHLVYIDSSLAAMQLMLACETLGLSTCPINFPDIEARERQLAELLALPVNVRPVMMMAVGYADKSGQIPYSQKKTPAQLVQYVSLDKEHR